MTTHPEIQNAAAPVGDAVDPAAVAAVVAAANQANGTVAIPRFVGMEPNKPFHVGYLDENGTEQNEKFEVAGTIPADLFAALADTVEKLSTDESSADVMKQYQVLRDVMELILTSESWTRFSARLASRDRPIGVHQLIRIAMGLLGELFGGVPTQLPSPSTSSPGTAGQSSTDGQPAEESTPDPSPGTDTSTSSTTGSSEG